MYSPHNEHDLVYDNYEKGWFYVSHYDIEREKNKFRYVYHGQVFKSSKTGKSWQYYKQGNELKVKPFKEEKK